MSAEIADILIYAFRYALGRSSYAPADVMQALAAHLPELDPASRATIAREIRAELGRDNPPLPYAEDWRRTMDMLASGAAE